MATELHKVKEERKREREKRKEGGNGDRSGKDDGGPWLCRVPFPEWTVASWSPSRAGIPRWLRQGCVVS